MLIEAIAFHNSVQDVLSSLNEIEVYCDDEVALPTDVEEASKRLEDLAKHCQQVESNVCTCSYVMHVVAEFYLLENLYS